MTDTLKIETRKEFFIRTLADPVLIYTVIAMASIMNHYRSSLTIAYSIAAYVIGWAVFRLFDFINKHHVAGTFAYIVLFSAFAVTTRAAINKGHENYNIPWGLWFLTPQEAMQYNKWYTLAVFMLFLIFMLSVIYYFTRVRYRLFMNFLILIIPFSIYGKENEEMSIGFIVALCVGFFVVLANFRQMSSNKESEAVDRPEMFRSAAVFTVLFALAAAFVPKPAIEADRTMIETLIDADALTDRFLAMLGTFRDDSTGDIFRRNNLNIPLYTVKAPEPMQFKTATFTDYDYETDSWKAGRCDSNTINILYYPTEIKINYGAAEAALEAARIDSDLAEKYGLTPYLDLKLSPVEEKEIYVQSLNSRGNAVPVPAGASAIKETNYEEDLGITGAGTIFSVSGMFGGRENFTFRYRPNSYFYSPANRELAAHLATLSWEEYSDLLYDSYDVLQEAIEELFEEDEDDDDEFDSDRYYELAALRNPISMQENQPLIAEANYMDYGGDQQICDLALEITSGAETPFEKATALEYYFLNNKYKYDLEYRKAAGENVKDFLFRTKTGVCYEYATAMTLLARAAGIPARYCEGYNMQTKHGDENSDEYLITSNDAHGFPELYIKGYGWMTFEPTMTAGVEVKEEKSAKSLLVMVGIAIFIASVIALGLIFLYPIIAHTIFMWLNRRRSPNDAVSAVIRRICRIYGIPGTASVHEAEEAVYRRSGASLAATAELFDRAEYGEAQLTENDKTKAIEEYVSAYKALGEAKKAERKNRKNKSRAAQG